MFPPSRLFCSSFGAKDQFPLHHVHHILCCFLLLSAVELICVMVRNKQQHGADVVQSGSEVTEDPSFLEHLLSLWHCHSSLLGKTSLPVLQLIRVVMVGAAVQPVWDKEFTGFVCDTQQPGCTHAAFSHIFSLSLHQYWTLQCDQGAQVKGHVLRAYLGLLSAGVLLEVGFALFQAVTFGFYLSNTYKCGMNPCPGQVDCYMSQTTEKSWFIVIMFTVTCLSGLFTLIELCVVLIRARPWNKQQNNKISETSGFQMDLKEEGATAESNESSSKLNI
ncbi:gap junction alpha-3 protein-like isoform X2 [Betta splendens]|uniref:Gap junction alpha-3 protein-like isoform X2 n=1 Tax=Betta splendens TaxID=158456 RepID=A0A9W2XMC7_BETSP|nr:gap junction alpha-3 protein-like isoform X2 [Betta splendens]